MYAQIVELIIFNFEVTKNLAACVKLTTLLTFNNCFTSNWIWSISTTVLLPLVPDLVLYTTDWVEIYGPLQNWSLAPQMDRIKVKVSFGQNREANSNQRR